MITRLIKCNSYTDMMQSSALLETMPSVMLIFPHSENCDSIKIHNNHVKMQP